MIFITIFEQNECVAIASTNIRSGEQSTAPYEALLNVLTEKAI